MIVVSVDDLLESSGDPSLMISGEQSLIQVVLKMHYYSLFLPLASQIRMLIFE